MISFTFDLLRKEYVTSNDRLHYKTHARRVARLVALGKEKAEVEGASLPFAHLAISVQWPDRRDRDTPNIWPTAKALEDGLVRGGLLPDDNDRFILSTLFLPHAERSGTRGVTRVTLRFSETLTLG